VFVATRSSSAFSSALLVAVAVACTSSHHDKVCPKNQPAFRIQLTASDGPLPSDTVLTVTYSGTEMESYSLAHGGADNQDVCCRPGSPTSGALADVPCGIPPVVAMEASVSVSMRDAGTIHDAAVTPSIRPDAAAIARGVQRERVDRRRAAAGQHVPRAHPHLARGAVQRPLRRDGDLRRGRAPVGHGQPRNQDPRPGVKGRLRPGSALVGPDIGVQLERVDVQRLRAHCPQTTLGSQRQVAWPLALGVEGDLPPTASVDAAMMRAHGLAVGGDIEVARQTMSRAVPVQRDRDPRRHPGAIEEGAFVCLWRFRNSGCRLLSARE